MLDEDAIVRQFEYHLAQGCKDGLVSDPREWPGVHTARAACKGTTVLWGQWIDRTALYAARRRGEKVREADFTERVPVRLSPIPPWAHMTPRQYARACRTLVRKIREKAAGEFRTFLGPRRIREQDPHARPQGTKRTKRPVCHASDGETWFAFVKDWWQFRLAYRMASRGRTQPADVQAYPANCFLAGGTYLPA